MQARLTILRPPKSPAQDAQALALGALGWVLADQPRADRLLALTGLNAEALRAGLADPARRPAVLGAVLEFLAANERDLVAAADALGVTPGDLISAQERLA